MSIICLTLQSYGDFSCKNIAHLVDLPYHKHGISLKNASGMAVLYVIYTFSGAVVVSESKVRAAHYPVFSEGDVNYLVNDK